ncbi:MAG: LysE family transporter [Actinomycetota bacterium]|nr:LysE family transporter [Actinomycetota bacterium]
MLGSMPPAIVIAFATGFGLGLLVAAQVGPIWLLCARSVLRGRLLTGLGIGLGAALVDTGYAALGVAGVTQLLRITQVRLALGLAGAAVLLAVGARTLWSAFRIRGGSEADEEVISPSRAFRTAAIATASNPLTIVSWTAIFAAASTAAHIARTTPAAVMLLAGIGFGSFALFAALSVSVSIVRRHVGQRALRLVDAMSGLGIIGFGGLLGWRALHQP